MFTIPYVFAWYPELLLIPEAVTITDDTGRRVLIDGYTGQVDLTALLLLGARLLLALYLIASALTGYDQAPLRQWEVVARLLVAVLVLWKTVPIMGAGLVLAVLLIGVHFVLARTNTIRPAA
jgi:TRAP-type uncharacterized transport system fused permease subunit